MYSMNRRMRPVPRKRRAIGRMACSFQPRFTTMFSLIGPRPAASAASIPASTLATGTRASFRRMKVSSSSASRLMVTRCSPASRNAAACAGSSTPLVVRVRSRTPGSAASCRHQGRQLAPDQRLAAGQPHLLDAQPR